MRDLTESALRGIFAEESGEIWLVLLEISDPSTTTPICAVNNTEDIVHNGKTYTAYPFEIVLPVSDGQTQPATTVRISNVSTDLIKILREMETPVQISIKIVMFSELDDVKVEIKRLELKQLRADPQIIEFSILSPSFLSARFPAHGYGRSTFRGMFR